MLLLIDADDTLWENNVYFERVIEEFIRFVNHPEYSHQDVRRALGEIERANAAIDGYGSAAFGRNLQQAFRQLRQQPVSDEQMAYVAGLSASIARQELEILQGVPETLEYLAERHRLVLFTKGNEEEQLGKIASSGLVRFFFQTRVVREKDPTTYCRAAVQFGADPAETWMIGNSPRSDINPALAAGLNAVWIPRPTTWALEQEPVRNGRGRLVVISRFSDLREIF